MKFYKIYVYIFILILFGNCSSEIKTDNDINNNSEIYRLESLDYKQLKKQFHKKNDTLYLLNFWATWCKPCVEELPYFMELNKEMRNKKFKMILVSLDRPSSFETNLTSFVKKNDLKVDVFLLNDISRMNFWITDIDSSWSGAIPATLLYKNGKKKFFIEKQLSKDELFEIINNNYN